MFFFGMFLGCKYRTSGGGPGCLGLFDIGGYTTQLYYPGWLFERLVQIRMGNCFFNSTMTLEWESIGMYSRGPKSKTASGCIGARFFGNLLLPHQKWQTIFDFMVCW